MKTVENENPNEISSESQRAKILKYLQEGETITSLEGATITSLEALKMFKCFRLASRMTDLKKGGVAFDSLFITTPSDKRVKAYFIPEAFAEKHHLELDDELPAYVSIYATEKISAR